ncbi:MAG TPA: DUF4082 domain-containing protein [Chitinophaga sp.]|nr:DUF4082 domain-containing protein [Chitinophaga sp.]
MKNNPRTRSTVLIAIILMGSWLTSCKRELLPEKNLIAATPGTGAYTVLTTERPALPPVAEGPVELGMQFKSSTSGTITKFRYYKVAGETGTHTGRLWSANGRLLKTAVFSAETDTGWQTVTLDTPYSISADTVYIIAVNSRSYYAATWEGLATAISNGPLSSIGGKNGVYNYTAGGFPASSYRNTNYFRDIEFVPTQDDPLPPAAPANLSASNITTSSTTLKWSAATDNIGVTAYEIYRNGMLINTIQDTTVTISNLNMGGLYSFYIKAKDAFGNRSVASNLADFTTLSTSGITHGSQLTTSMVGPQGIGISSFTTVPGGTFSGTALGGWGSAARTIGAGGETIDGFWFPAGTVVLQGADISSGITVTSGWLVLRGCKGGILVDHPAGNGGGAAALFCQLTYFNTGGLKDRRQPAASTVYRCYFPHSGLENVYADNITVTESWITPDPDTVGTDHIDGIQTWGGQRYLNFSRNHMEFNPPHTAPYGLSALIGMYSDGTQEGFDGYDHVMVNDNYFILNAYGIALHAPLAVPVTNMSVTGNRWIWSNAAEDENYTNAVYHNPSQSIPDYTAVNGNKWQNNQWADGPHAGSFLLPDNATSVTDYKQ